MRAFTKSATGADPLSCRCDHQRRACSCRNSGCVGLCTQHARPLAPTLSPARTGVDRFSGDVRRWRIVAVVGRISRLGNGHIPVVFSHWGRAQRAVAGTWHRVSVGRTRMGKPRSHVAHCALGCCHRGGAYSSNSGGGLWARSASGQRDLWCSAAGFRRRGLRRLGVGHHRRCAVVGLASDARPAAGYCRGCSANGVTAQAVGVGQCAHCGGHCGPVARLQVVSAKIEPLRSRCWLAFAFCSPDSWWPVVAQADALALPNHISERRSNFPVMLRGNSSTKSTLVGHLYRASSPLQ